LGEHFVDDATLLEPAGQYNHNLMRRQTSWGLPPWDSYS
jgi:hypothetical protein